MNRLTSIAIALTVLVGGLLLFRGSTGCSGSFEFVYTSPLSAIISTNADGEESKHCEHLARELLNLDLAATEIGVSRSQLSRRVKIDGYPTDTRDSICRIIYRGDGVSNTRLGISALMVGFLHGMLQYAEAERARVKETIRQAREEITQRTMLAQSSTGATNIDKKQWAFGGDVEGWTAEEYENVLERLRQSLAVENEKLSELFCVEYFEKIRSHPTDQNQALEAQCRDSKPIGITQWPELTDNCNEGDGETINGSVAKR